MGKQGKQTWKCHCLGGKEGAVTRAINQGVGVQLLPVAHPRGYRTAPLPVFWVWYQVRVRVTGQSREF